MRTRSETGCYRVVVEPNGTNGPMTAAQMRPDVAVIGVGLPSIDGYQVAHNLRFLEIGQTALPVALTGDGRSEDRARASHAFVADATTRRPHHAAQA